MPLKSKIKDFLATAEGFYLSELLNKIGLNVEQFLIYCKGVKKKSLWQSGRDHCQVKRVPPSLEIIRNKALSERIICGSVVVS